MRRLLRLLALTLLAGFVAAWTAPALWADGEPIVVPDVVGRTPEEARQALEALGLAPLLVPVAGPPPGRVERQEPIAGARVALGVQVVVRHGIALRLETRAPDMRRRLLSEVGPELEGAYTLEVELVFAPGGPDGEILEQSPAAGATLWYRGVLALKVRCLQCHAGTVVVPALVGRPEVEALELLTSAGLRPVVEYRPEPNQPAGLVSAQDPRSGAELLYGGTIYLRVSGTPPPAPPEALPVPAPNLVGLEMNVALSSAQALGFLPQLTFQVGSPPWTVLQQQPVAGTPLAPGAVVALVVALPGPAPGHVTLPSLFGRSQHEALQILSALGLGGQAELKQVGFPVGLVFSQQPAPGAVVARGSVVALSVSKGAGPQGVPLAQMPALVGLTALQAFHKLVLAGLTPKGLQHLAPQHPLDIVDAQSPAPGAFLPAGSEGRFFVPTSALVPALLGHTRSQAIDLLQAAGFNAQPQGPAFGVGFTVVVAQSAPAGALRARGSSVSFAFKFQQGGGWPVKVQVPQLLGGTKQDAVAALQQQGLGVDLDRQGPVLPGPGTKVIAQVPSAGAFVTPGTVVKVTYVEQLALAPQLVTVPGLTGKTRAQAQAALDALGLTAKFNGAGGNPTKLLVILQAPAAGAKVAPGSLVTMVVVPKP